MLWNDYRNAARERGALALELYVVRSIPGDDPQAVKANLADHLAYQRQLEEAGLLAFAGPLSDETGDQMQGEGMIVYRATSLLHANQLAQSDPMHVSNARHYSIRKWLINEGSLSLSVGLSTKTIKLD
ncbi:YciI family protein [Cohaesibacter celericrescens]|uniref:YCII-related domain-containing protein n=1 Tax=Cohaesibacter celericrescens TaxID=2067669 RepID=A0A2N5XX18_9HYPH|nr:YciI family protein [Cohaesibacter celericrescens]PLW78985.1 hypothetical protein C0081_01745 [Cohaesibacter celericrescens]